MFNRKLPLFKLFGFSVGIDITWLILAVLITWSLAEGLFPHYIKGISTTAYWIMGLAGALGLFFSIIFHEFCHSLVARKFDLPMKGITLFIFGGVAEMDKEPDSPKSEFLMAIAGPISSVVLAGVFYGIYALGEALAWPVTVTIVLGYLAVLNLILAAFNMVPAFPLDGGRILRSILWYIKKDLRWATRVSSNLGAAAGLLLIVFGVFNFIMGAFIAGIWYALIGMFIRSAAQGSYRQLIVKNALEGESVSHFMKADPVTVPPEISVKELANGYFYKYHYKMFPVSADGNPRGCVTTKNIKNIPRDKWDEYSVEQISDKCSDENVVSPDTDAMKAMSIMNRTGNSRLMVVSEDRLVGVVTLKDLLGFLAMKIDLEG